MTVENLLLFLLLSGVVVYLAGIIIFPKVKPLRSSKIRVIGPITPYQWLEIERNNSNQINMLQHEIYTTRLEADKTPKPSDDNLRPMTKYDITPNTIVWSNDPTNVYWLRVEERNPRDPNDESFISDGSYYFVSEHSIEKRRNVT